MRLPIRARLTLLAGLLMAAVLVALGAFVYIRFDAELLATVDAGLRARAEVLLNTSNDRGVASGGGLIDRDEVFAQLLSRDGRALQTTAGIREVPLLSSDVVAALGTPRTLTASVQTLEETVTARLLAVPTGGEVLVVGTSLEDQEAALARLLGLMLLGGPVGVLLASGVGWLVAGGALRPVERLRIEAEAISGSEPGRRLPVPATRDELARLGESLNRMLGRLEEALERERRFVGDASHELRTPLANLKAELELALRRARSAEELTAALHGAAAETDRLARLGEDLLILARTDDGHVPLRKERLDLGQLARDEVESFVGRAAELGISLRVTASDGFHAEVDGTRVRQAIGNLIDNALRHTPSGGEVQLSLIAGDDGPTIEVADSGEGFSPEFLDLAFDPFSRSDSTRSRIAGGAGLGLPIVRAIAEAHGGTVAATNRPEGGASVVLRLPA